MISPALLAVSFVLPLLAAKDLAPPEKPVFPQAGPQQSDSAAAPDPFLTDAQLHDVFFLDAWRGWAVGDRGVIWHTDDGGRHWSLQHSGVRNTLRSVCFINAKTGFAAGGDALPYTHDGSGVFLSTRDGGKTWHGLGRQILPPLRRIRFVDAEIGWAIATPSALFPSGIFFTPDAGRSWKPMSGRAPTAWLTGELIDPLTGAVAGRNGVAARLLRGGIEPPRGESFGLRNLRAMKLQPPGGGWLVGDGGFVMTTGDLGATWRTPPGEIPPELAAEFDFAALAVRGENVWIAGTPGTRVFHSPDAGRSWNAFPTGNRLPLEALAFADDRHGWAVGALGAILATEDGGRTWQRQHGGGARAALLVLVAQADAVPLELLARLAGQEGYLAAVEVLTRRDVETPEEDEIPLPDRLQQAVVAVGGSRADLAWQFPLRQQGVQQTPQQFIDHWDRTHDGRGLQMLETHLVRQIRLWRPDIIVTGGAIPTKVPSRDPLGELISQQVLASAEKAGEATACPRQITEAGLEPWQVKRVFISADAGGEGTIEWSTSQLLSRLGGAASDVAAEPRGLLQDSAVSAPALLGFRTILDRLSERPSAATGLSGSVDGTVGPANSGTPRLAFGGPRSQADFFTGIFLPPGGEARRELFDPPAENLAAWRRIALKRRNTLAILEKSQGDPRIQEQLLAQTADLLDGLDDAQAAQLLANMAERSICSGRWRAAAELYAQLAERYPQHPSARAALLWLVQYYTSGEAAWREQSQQRYAVRQVSALAESGKGDSPLLPERPAGYFVQKGTVPFSGLAMDQGEMKDRAGRAAGFGKQIEQTRPELFAAPALRFVLAAAHRQQGYSGQSERFYLFQSHGSTGDAWTLCAQGEQWLIHPEGQPPKPTMPCFAAVAKPRLDGRLDDAVWKKVKPAPLKSAVEDDALWPACAALAYDREYLYIAVHCQKAPGVNYPPAAGPRSRDADLSGSDRVEILIDIDRDYTTYYHLTIDYRGGTAEDCWGDASWNPTWYVAADGDAETWTVEAAVPWEELTGRIPRPKDAWCLGVQRTVPGVGFQSWSTPASTKITPEGFGYLLFD